MSTLKGKICFAIRCIIQPLQDNINKKRLKADNFTIICSTCAGGIIYHRLGKQFLSPTVNLWFTDKDLQKIARDLKHYMTTELVFIEDYSVPYPVAMLDDVKIYFNHAKTAEEAQKIWNRRRTRINYDNVWLISCDRGLDYTDIENFGGLPAKGKVLFTAKEYPEFDYCLCFKEYEKRGEATVGEYMSNHTPILDHFVFEKYFDYVKWLNTGKIK